MLKLGSWPAGAVSQGVYNVKFVARRLQLQVKCMQLGFFPHSSLVALAPVLPGCICWLVGCSGFNGPLREYFSLYRAVSQRGRKRTGRIDESKNVLKKPTRTYCKCSRPLPYCNPNCRTPRGTGSLPRTIAPPDHPLQDV